MAHGTGFQGAPSRAQIPTFCGNCHANRLLMKQYGLPAQEFEDYKLSEHGKAWAAGDVTAAVCTDCHKTHGILPPDDTRSSVYPSNVPDMCGSCHADEKLMSAHGLPSDTLDQYKGSVHGIALLVGENQAAPSCASCHGNHAALPPAAAEIGNVCGQCHRQIVDRLRQSDHAEAVADGSLTECIGCHEHHPIQPADPSLIQTVCRQCHDSGTHAADEAGRIYEFISNAQDDYDGALAAIAELREKGRAVSDLESHLEEAHTKLVQTADIQHLLDAQQVEKYTIAVTDMSREVREEVAAVENELNERKLLLIVFWVVILLMVCLLLVKRAHATMEPTPSPTGGDGR